MMALRIVAGIFVTKRIKVIHRENGGLSAARNSGIDVCRGEYIGFVDSDDAIHPEMYSRLYEDIAKYGTKLAFCQPLVCGDIPASFPEVLPKEKCLSSNDVIRESLSESMWFSAWTKLYHRSLFDGIRYPEGRINEDYPVTMRIFDRCDRIVVDYNKLYAYCKRGGSITTSPVSEKSFDQVISAEESYLFIRETHPDFSPLAARILMASCLLVRLFTICECSKYVVMRDYWVFMQKNIIFIQFVKHPIPHESQHEPTPA